MKDAYAEFLKNAEEFIFAENTPEKSDIIFVPGNGFKLFKVFSHTWQENGRLDGSLYQL